MLVLIAVEPWNICLSLPLCLSIKQQDDSSVEPFEPLTERTGTQQLNLKCCQKPWPSASWVLKGLSILVKEP